ncbi:CMD domain protein [Ancylobacter sp. WKF20]|uniref:CMD domain-containing protein n=1 Tax=Ancylobacter sp. WKF20 TaxID=3039801 RepID=UPI0024343F4B|nr:CMD domain protein [Ancylobacter sp. WKF20]WGD29147.1 CMD domain protein [Ancylobacter sp. WKF20]
MSDSATAPLPDVIDTVLGLDGSSPTLALRQQRERLKQLTQTSYLAALRPADPRNFSYARRAALAARMAAAWKATELNAHYTAALAAEGGDAEDVRIADPAFRPDDAASPLAVLLRHVDLVTLSPKAATRANIEALKAAGLDDRDIVALAGLIAFVNYQVLLVAGLKMLRDH